jgi:protein-disulfide isomerase
MLRLLTITVLLGSYLIANDKTKKGEDKKLTIEQMIIKYEKHRISQNDNIELKSLKIKFKKDLHYRNWIGYAIAAKIYITKQKKTIDITDILFSDGNIISVELQRLKNSFKLQKLVYPTLAFGTRYYTKDHLIAGNANASHQIVIFSDPLCPVCIETMPNLIKDVQANPKKLSLYYIRMPLEMHPTAKTLTKAALLAHEQGVKNIDYKLYTAKFDDDFDPYVEKDNAKVLKLFNKKFNTKITMADLNSTKLDDFIKSDHDLVENATVRGTPTIFIDGEIDPSRTQYKQFIKND